MADVARHTMKELLLLAGLGGLLYLVGNSGNNRLTGGRGDRLRPEDVDASELKKGIRHELEHVHTGDRIYDRQVAQEIALDHLAEFDNYYSVLDDAEKRMRPRRRIRMRKR